MNLEMFLWSIGFFRKSDNISEATINLENRAIVVA